MKKILYVLLTSYFLPLTLAAQVKSNFLYSPSMPYGTLDIRTTISSTQYYYLKEGQTFSYRESSPGVKTNTYRDMTSWESSSYKQGHLRYKSGTSDKYVMNYRLLSPSGYSSYSPGYPLIVILHGGVERGNCYYTTCYHGTWDWDPNVNSPKAPTSSTHNLLSNDNNLINGGKQHLDARNLAGTRLPNSTSMPSRAFPGFVLVPHMLNDWDGKSVEHMIRIIQLHIKKYKIDPNRVYVHGLSVGGAAVYEALKRGSWLFAAAMPMAANRNGRIFEENQQNLVINIPLWVFQGGEDTNPTPTTTRALIDKWKAAGAVVRYSEYATLGHSIWNTAYAEPDFFTWLLTKNKANIHPYKGRTVIVKSTSTYPKLLLPQGFFAYQWQKDGVTQSNTTYSLTATVKGVYRARFSRVANPTSTQWNQWSAPVTVTEGTAITAGLEDEVIAAAPEEQLEETEDIVSVFPNPATPDNINIQYNQGRTLSIQMVDAMGRTVHTDTYDSYADEPRRLERTPVLADGLYYVIIEVGDKQFRERVFIKN